MVFYPIRIRMCPNLLMVRPSQGHVLLIRLSYLMIRTCIGKQMDTSVRDITPLLKGRRPRWPLYTWFGLFAKARTRKGLLLFS